MTLEVAILIITGIAALVVQMIYFLLDDRSENHTDKERQLKLWWHAAAGGIHTWMSYTIARIANDWHAGFLMGSLTWMFFDGAINCWVLHREWFYIPNDDRSWQP